MQERFLVLASLFLLFFVGGATSPGWSSIEREAWGYSYEPHATELSDLVVCSITTSRGELAAGDPGYTLDGIRMVSARAKLLDATNFGPEGTVSATITIIDGFGELDSITDDALEVCDIFFMGSFGNTDISDAEFEALYNWSLPPKKLVIITGQPPFSVAAPGFWGYELEVGNNNPTTPTEIGAEHPFFDGPFGTVTSVNQGGTAQGFFSTTAEATILAQNAVNNPVILLDSTTSDVLIADTDYFTNLGSMSSGSGILNSADVFWANLIAGVADVVLTGVEPVEGTELPTELKLEQNYPNPFNGSTTIRFTLPRASRLTLNVYDLQGRNVATLVSGNYSAGRYEYEWDAEGVVSGMYFYTLETETYSKTMKLLLHR